MKVLNVNQSFEIKGGSDVYFNSLSKLLRANGIEVDEFASSATESDEFPLSVNFADPSLSDIYKYIYNNDAKNKLAKFLADRKIDIAHVHIYYGMLTSSILKPLRNSSIPIIQTLHEYKVVCPTYKLYDGDNICFTCKNNQFYKSLYKRCNRDSLPRTAISALESYVSLWNGSQTINHYITVSDFQKSQIVKMGFDPGNITTVHNFVKINESLLVSKTGEYVLYYGRIEKVKGIDVLLDAFEELDASVKLVIVGDGDYRNHMLSRIESSRFLKANTSYLGFKNSTEIAQIVANAKFVVVPSIWYETFGLTVVEAMALGKVVIGSNLGGITEIIDDGSDGFLIEPNNHLALKEKIVELWNNQPLLSLLGASAYQKVKEKFSPDAHFNKIKEIYSRYC